MDGIYIIDFIQIGWLLIIIFQLFIGILFLQGYRRDKDKFKLIFGVSLIFITYSHIYEMIDSSLYGPIDVNGVITNIQYWSFFPLVISLWLITHKDFFKIKNDNKTFIIFSTIITILFSYFLITPYPAVNYAGIIEILITLEILFFSFYHILKKKVLTDIIFDLALLCLILTGLSLMLRYPTQITIFLFFLADILIGLAFYIPYANTQSTSSIGDLFSIKKELQKTQEKLSDAHQSFQTLFDQMVDPVVIVDGTGNIIEASNKFFEILGVKKDEMIGQNFLTTSYFDSKTKRLLIKNVLLRLAGKYIPPYEVNVYSKTGAKVPFEIHAGRVKYHGKNVDMAVFRDLRERKKNQMKIKETEKRYQEIFSQSGDGIFLVDSEGEVIDVNNTLVDMFGYTKSEFKKLTIMDLHPPYAIEQAKNAFDQIMRHGKISFEANYIKKNGEVFIGGINASLITIGGEKVIQGTFRDITERKHAEDELKKAHKKLQDLNNELDQKVVERTEKIEFLLKQKDDFINQLGHDLKNPLGPLINLLPILEQKLEDEENKEIVRVLIRNAQYMKNLVAKTLDLAQLNSPKMKFTFENISLRNRVEDVLENNKLLLNEKQITVTNNISDSCYVMADKLRVDELLTNILNNSVKYSYDHGSIFFDVKELDDEVQVSITDTGIGMTDAQMERLFDEFYKADESRHDFDSSGLGMPITKRIIELHGGKIWAESEGLGKGCTIYFTLPLNSHNEDISKATNS